MAAAGLGGELRVRGEELAVPGPLRGWDHAQR